MKLSEISIRRPVLATVMSLAILLVGLIALLRLPVREYPDIDPPIVSISAFDRGASPSGVETEITDVLEEQLSTLEGVKAITSSSREQGAVITVEFETSRDHNEAANDVRDRVARVRGSLPREADDPIVSKVDVDAQPIMWLALSSTRHNTLELSEIADVLLKERIQRLPGVGSVFIGGERRYAMRVWLDPQRLAAHGLTTQDVEQAIRAENAEIPGGRVEGSQREFAVRTRGEVASPQEFAALIVAQHGSQLVRLGDVAEVTLGAEDYRTVARYNGNAAIGLGVAKQSKASTLDVTAEVSAALPDLSTLLAEGMRLDVAYDSSTFIRKSVREVWETLFMGMGLVILVIFVFLKSFRATLIPAVAIPTSIIGTFTIVYFMGFTINILTLLAFVLAIGLVVDDAIVLLENVYRHMELGKPRRKAAFEGSQEIGFAVLATTIALVAVFVPVAFLTGNVGRLFKEFGISVAVAVAISGFVALSLTPMLCSRMLKPLYGISSNWAARSFDAFFAALHRGYEKLLRGAVRWRFAVVAAGLAVVAGSFYLYHILPREFVPVEDRNIAFGIVLAPEGATLDYTDRYMRDVEARLLPLPERAGLFTATGLGFGGPGRVTDGFVFLRLKPREERDKSQQQIIQELFPQLLSIPGVLAFLISPPSLGGRFSSSPVEYVLQGDTYEELQVGVRAMMQEASKLGYLVNLDSDLHLNKPQLDITIDRERAAQLGVSVSDIGTTLETFLGGRVVSDFKRGSKQYDVIAQMKPDQRARPDAIEGIYLKGSGGLVQLANVVHVRETVAPKELNHFNRIRSATLTANPAPGVSLGQALADLDHIAAAHLPGTLKRVLGGQSREFRDTSGKLYFTFIFAVVFIYLVLGAQFESFVHPFTILLSVPLAVAGALVSLVAFKQSLNIYSQIGLIMLVGLVTKNAILIVEYSNQLRSRGLELRDAVIQASKIRLRPILMTTLTTIFGVLPIAIGLGAGAESRRPLGIAVVGGLFFSMFLTLLVVPVVYVLLARFTVPHRARAHAPEAGEAEGLPAAAS